MKRRVAELEEQLAYQRRDRDDRQRLKRRPRSLRLVLYTMLALGLALPWVLRMAERPLEVRIVDATSESSRNRLEVRWEGRVENRGVFAVSEGDRCTLRVKHDRLLGGPTPQEHLSVELTCNGSLMYRRPRQSTEKGTYTGCLLLDDPIGLSCLDSAMLGGTYLSADTYEGRLSLGASKPGSQLRVRLEEAPTVLHGATHAAIRQGDGRVLRSTIAASRGDGPAAGTACRIYVRPASRASDGCHVSVWCDGGGAAPYQGLAHGWCEGPVVVDTTPYDPRLGPYPPDPVLLLDAPEGWGLIADDHRGYFARLRVEVAPG